MVIHNRRKARKRDKENIFTALSLLFIVFAGGCLGGATEGLELDYGWLAGVVVCLVASIVCAVRMVREQNQRGERR